MGDFVEVESKNPDHKKHKLKCFLIFPEPKEVDLVFFRVLRKQYAS